MITSLKQSLATFLAVSVLGAIQAADLAASKTVYEWSGNGNDNSAQNDDNWVGGNSPIGDTWLKTEDIDDLYVLFTAGTNGSVSYTDLYANTIEFRNVDQPFYLTGDSYTTHIGSGGISYSATDDFYSKISGPVQLHADQIWNIQNGTLEIDGAISDLTDSEGPNYAFRQIEKTGAGTLELSSSYTSGWAGGLKLTEGTVKFSYMSGSSSTALGNGTLIFNGGTLETESSYESAGDSGEANIYNDVISKGLVSIQSKRPVNFENSESGQNLFQIEADTTFSISGSPVYIDKNITQTGGSHLVTLDAETALILTGGNQWSGGTHVKKGVLIFGGDNNIPSTGAILIDSKGYAGIGAENTTSLFLASVDTVNSVGAIGFDSDLEEGGPDTFSDAVDLTGFNPLLRIGSATAAILTGTITPQSTDYRFGGGGGSLYVGSMLSDNGVAIPRNLVADSPSEAPLTVQILNPTNTFTGTVLANDSAIIFGDAVPLPGASGNFSMNSGGYIGNAHNPGADTSEISVSDFLDHFSSTTFGIIGFDITNDSTETRVIDLTGASLSGFANPVSLGTASVLKDSSGDITGPGVQFTGTIAGDSAGTHRFAAYKGGALEVAGSLTGSSLVIGDPDSTGAFGDERQQSRSTVLISGDNSDSLSGGTTLYGGHLKVGQHSSDGTIGTDPTHALGSAAITVKPINVSFTDDDDDPSALLSVSADDIIINNDIILEADLLVGDKRNFTLGGTLSGTGEIYVGEEADSSMTLTLSGNNTHEGGVYIANSSFVNFNHDNAAGMGALGFGSSGGSATFNSANPVVYGLESKDDAYGNITLGAEVPRTLTINQSLSSYFNGYINASGESTIIKSGAGTLRFENGSITSSGIDDGFGHDISLEIKEGTFAVGSNASLGNGAILVSGGTLAASHDTYISNEVHVNSGRIAGSGTYNSAVYINRGGILSPGLDDESAVGHLKMAHLELGSGGIFEFNIQIPDAEDQTGHDYISIFTPNTLVINSTTADPFMIKVISLGSDGELGDLVGIDDDFGTYSWTLFSFDALSIPGNSDLFDADLFAFDLSAFSSDSLVGGEFGIMQDGNEFKLTFTPVPEPSTYAMMAVGLGIIGLTWWRRRRPQA